MNPKDAIASAKPDLSLATRPMLEAIAAALANGARKYGRLNWRLTPVRALVYTAAAVRHIKAYEDGEDLASDSGVHHLDHAIASLCILRDAAAHGTLRDDRGPATPAQPPATPTPASAGFVVYLDERRSANIGLSGEVFPDEAAAGAAIQRYGARSLAGKLMNYSVRKVST